MALRRENGQQRRPGGAAKRLDMLAAQDPGLEKISKRGGPYRFHSCPLKLWPLLPGIVAQAPLLNQGKVLAGIALVVTIGVYGLGGWLLSNPWMIWGTVGGKA